MMKEQIKKYFIHTYGCQMNVHESEKIAGILEKHGYEKTDIDTEADIIVFNTCCIRESAETRVLGNLGYTKKIKEANPDLIIAVCGCMSQKSGTAEMLKKRCPFIDIIIGTHNLDQFGNYLEKVEKERIKIIDIKNQEEYSHKDNETIKRDEGIGAYINIMYGCNNFCSYCIVPYVRGRERSRSVDDILSECKSVINAGYKEITLLGQNVNSYAYTDEKGKKYDFGDLIDLLSDIKGDFKIKFMTSHPKDISEKLVRIISEKENLAKYIHLPLQSGSDRILQLMNRKYNSQSYLEKIDMIRHYMPDCGITSDIIVGFPTETDEDFYATETIVKRVKFNNLFTFIYSRRRGTVADKMEGQIDIKIKRQRIKQLIDLQFQIGSEMAEKQIGKIARVLCETSNGNEGYGKSQNDTPVYFCSEESPKVGSFYDIIIDSHKNTKLYGKIKRRGE